MATHIIILFSILFYSSSGLAEQIANINENSSLNSEHIFSAGGDSSGGGGKPPIHGLINTEFDGWSGFITITGQLAAKLYKELEVPVNTFGDYKTKQGKNYKCTSEAGLVYECNMIIEDTRTGVIEEIQPKSW